MKGSKRGTGPPPTVMHLEGALIDEMPCSGHSPELRDRCSVCTAAHVGVQRPVEVRV